jgi:hypothetical protein
VLAELEHMVGHGGVDEAVAVDVEQEQLVEFADREQTRLVGLGKVLNQTRLVCELLKKFGMSEKLSGLGAI